MSRALRVCAEPGCPALVTTGRCIAHRRARESARGTRQQRGYDASHDVERRRWVPLVATGTVTCWRCGHGIVPGSEWHLGHADDGATHRGPEHARECNLSAARKASQGLPCAPPGEGTSGT
jgi:hypothetical protein